MDDEVEKAKNLAKTELKDALSRKEELQRILEGQSDEEERTKLLKELGDLDETVMRLMA